MEEVFIGLYSRGEERGRGFLWKDLEVYKQKWDLPSIMGGDCNMVLSRQERSEEYFWRAYVEEFQETLDMFELLVLPLMGDK